MEMVIGLVVLFILVTVIFIAIAFFFPEWVGITGKKAKEIMESHHSSEDKDKNPK